MNTLFSRPWNCPKKQTKAAYLSALLNMLKTYPLRKDNSNQDGSFYTFEPTWVKCESRNEQGQKVYYFRNLPAGVFMCHGNFLNYSYAFSVYTDDPDVILKLLIAIDANMARPDYQEQIKTVYPPYVSKLFDDEIITDWAASLAQCGSGNDKTYIAFN